MYTVFLKDPAFKNTVFYMYYEESSLIIISRSVVWMTLNPAVIPGIITQRVLYDWLTCSNFSEILLYMDGVWNYVWHK